MLRTEERVKVEEKVASYQLSANDEVKSIFIFEDNNADIRIFMQGVQYHL